MENSKEQQRHDVERRRDQWITVKSSREYDVERSREQWRLVENSKEQQRV